MSKLVWLSYDLGVKGDYPGLYAWLDNHGASECGDSVAFFRYEGSSSDDLLTSLKAELEAAVELARTDRVYVVFKADDGKMKGRFIVGKRKAAPWQGYGDAITEDDA
jgi:hypothetical protein